MKRMQAIWRWLEEDPGPVMSVATWLAGMLMMASIMWGW